jgi:DTW domain-containing protein YfiP/predicted GNAT family acetyltransferase
MAMNLFSIGTCMILLSILARLVSAFPSASPKVAIPTVLLLLFVLVASFVSSLPYYYSSSAKKVIVQDYTPHLKAKIAHSVAKGERRAGERVVNRRRLCDGCLRPPAVCVCEQLPAQKFDTSTNILILQHPNERRKKNFSTVPLLRLVLKNVQVISGYTFEAEQLEAVKEALTKGQKPLLLYPDPDAISLDHVADGDSIAPKASHSDTQLLAAGDQNSSEQQRNSGNHLLIIMDGTWSESKRMVRDSPSLVERCQLVKFTSEASSIYNAIRREPHSHCLSTLEACARALELLEPASSDVPSITKHLHTVLQSHVDAHLFNAETMAPRSAGAASKKLYAKNKRRREIELTMFAASSSPSSSSSSPTETTSGGLSTQKQTRENLLIRLKQPRQPQREPKESKKCQDRKYRDDKALALSAKNKQAVLSPSSQLGQRLPDGAVLRTLQPSDAPWINSWSKHRTDKDLPMVSRRIKIDNEQGMGCCLGIEVNGCLVAAILRYELGALGMLHVQEDCRNRGYGTVLLQQATRALQAKGEERVAYIVDGNHASEALFTSAGWERFDPTIKGGTGKRRAKRKWIHR